MRQNDKSFLVLTKQTYKMYGPINGNKTTKHTQTHPYIGITIKFMVIILTPDNVYNMEYKIYTNVDKMYVLKNFIQILLLISIGVVLLVIH